MAVGASAGGIEALTELVASLPPDFPFAVMVAIHMWAGGPSVLAEILDRSGPLAATAATDGAILEPGRIYVAVPDNHLLARDHRVMLSDGPSESGRRPAIDVLFRSVALDYGSRAIGVLMSGLLDDGVAGLGRSRRPAEQRLFRTRWMRFFPTCPATLSSPEWQTMRLPRRTSVVFLDSWAIVVSRMRRWAPTGGPRSRSTQNRSGCDARPEEQVQAVAQAC